jgi:hypothetical protein
MAISRNCEGSSRRDFLKVGAIGATGLTMTNYLQMAEAGKVKSGTANAAIFINLQGGPSHMDTFDLKPESSDEYRGEFNPIDTNVPGIQISEHLPKLAQCQDLFTILRGVSHTLGAHRLGSEYVNTGSRPLPSLEYPGYGAVISKELEAPRDIPPFVAIPRSAQKPGFLGVRYAALNTGSTPQAGQPYSVRGIKLGNGLTISEVEKRHNLLRDLDSTFRGIEQDNQLIDGLDRFGQQAYYMITSKRSREAFDISKESPEITQMFGEDGFDQSCLLATRLVEAGSRFITISLGGWDTHRDGWTRLKDRNLPTLDSGLSGLLNGLKAKGLLDTTTVFVTGEFGRTPKINTERVGRDHYPRCMFMLMAGGGVKGGQVLGESNENATLPKDEVGFSPDDVAASLYHTLGIDHTAEYHTNTGRPIMIVRDGNVIEQLFG